MKMQVVIGIAFVLICSAVFVGCIENGNSSCKDLATINNRLSAEVENLTMAYNNKVDEYNYLVREYNNLSEQYGRFYTPSTLIKNGTIFWRYNKTDGTVLTWTLDMDTYRYFADWPALVQYLRIYNSRTGKTSSVNNLSLYVQPYFFDGVISDITTNLTDREFVQEVVTIKNQIIVESSSLGDHYHWSAETLTEGVGTSGDIAILMMSLLKSGNNQSQYGLQVSMVYCDVQNLTNPQNVNHVMVEVRYIDGTVVILDTTTNASYIENQVDGWKYLV